VPCFECRNRCFRCLFSSKAKIGESPMACQTLQLTMRYPPTGGMMPPPVQWLASMVCHTRPGAKLLQFSAQHQSAVANLLVAKPTIVRGIASGPVTRCQQQPLSSFTVRLSPPACHCYLNGIHWVQKAHETDVLQCCCDRMCTVLAGRYSLFFLHAVEETYEVPYHNL
jgi:hypothetical protein